MTSYGVLASALTSAYARDAPHARTSLHYRTDARRASLSRGIHAPVEESIAARAAPRSIGGALE
jgi:hypothetical protein